MFLLLVGEAGLSSVNLLFQDTVLPATDFLLFVLIYSFSQHYAPVLCFFNSFVALT